MTRDELVDRCKLIIQEAYDEATEMIVAYIELNPDEQLQPLCKEIDPENWNALRNRVQRAQGNRKAIRGADTTRARTIRRAKQVLRDAGPDELGEIMRDLPVGQRAEVVRAAVPPPQEKYTRSGPSFIDLLVRVSSSLIELEAMVASWQNPAAIPAEFSRESFSDIVAKVLRIQDHFDAVAEARDNEDEFQKIVRNFRVTSDAS